MGKKGNQASTMSAQEKAELERTRADTAKVYAETAETIMKGASIFVSARGEAAKSAAEAMKTKVEADNLMRQEDRYDRQEDRYDRQEDRADNESQSSIRNTETDRMIREDLHMMSREIHNGNVKVSHVENSAKAKFLKDDAIKASYDTLIYIKQKEKELLELGASKEEIEEMRRHTEDFMLVTNPAYQEGVRLRKEALELENENIRLRIEREVQQETNLKLITDSFRGVENSFKDKLNLNGSVDEVLGEFYSRAASNTDPESEEVKKISGLLKGYAKVVRLTKDYIGIRFFDGEEGGVEYMPINIDCGMFLPERALKSASPDSLDTLVINYEPLSLKEINAYNDDTAGSACQVSVFTSSIGNTFGTFSKGEEKGKINKFMISSTAREEIYKAVCKARGREYLSYKEKEELDDLYDRLSDAIVKQASNEKLRNYVLGKSVTKTDEKPKEESMYETLKEKLFGWW